MESSRSLPSPLTIPSKEYKVFGVSLSEEQPIYKALLSRSATSLDGGLHVNRNYGYESCVADESGRSLHQPVYVPQHTRRRSRDGIVYCSTVSFIAVLLIIIIIRLLYMVSNNHTFWRRHRVIIPNDQLDGQQDNIKHRLLCHVCTLDECLINYCPGSQVSYICLREGKKEQSEERINLDPNPNFYCSKDPFLWVNNPLCHDCCSNDMCAGQ